ncbi:MAG TPA: Hsp20/alpha crystallin family protein [Longimicrobiales bacterium]
MSSRTPSRFVSPWDALRDMREQMDDLLRSTFRGPFMRGAEFEPPVDITERDDALVLTAELPGMRREDVDVELENNVLTIRGEKKEEREEKRGERFLYERRYGSFSRSFTLPRAVDPDRISARFSNGVLTVTMPKMPEARGKRIEVEEGESRA